MVRIHLPPAESQQTFGSSLAIAPNPIFWNHREQIVTLAAKYGMPAIYPERAAWRLAESLRIASGDQSTAAAIRNS